MSFERNKFAGNPSIDSAEKNGYKLEKKSEGKENENTPLLHGKSKDPKDPKDPKDTNVELKDVELKKVKGKRKLKLSLSFHSLLVPATALFAVFGHKVTEIIVRCVALKNQFTVTPDEAYPNGTTSYERCDYYPHPWFNDTSTGQDVLGGVGYCKNNYEQFTYKLREVAFKSSWYNFRITKSISDSLYYLIGVGGGILIPLGVPIAYRTIEAICKGGKFDLTVQQKIKDYAIDKKLGVIDKIFYKIQYKGEEKSTIILGDKRYTTTKDKFKIVPRMSFLISLYASSFITSLSFARFLDGLKQHILFDGSFGGANLFFNYMSDQMLGNSERVINTTKNILSSAIEKGQDPSVRHPGGEVLDSNMIVPPGTDSILNQLTMAFSFLMDPSKSDFQMMLSFGNPEFIVDMLLWVLFSIAAISVTMAVDTYSKQKTVEINDDIPMIVEGFNDHDVIDPDAQREKPLDKKDDYEGTVVMDDEEKSGTEEVKIEIEEKNEEDEENKKDKGEEDKGKKTVLFQKKKIEKKENAKELKEELKIREEKLNTREEGLEKREEELKKQEEELKKRRKKRKAKKGEEPNKKEVVKSKKKKKRRKKKSTKKKLAIPASPKKVISMSEGGFFGRSKAVQLFLDASAPICDIGFPLGNLYLMNKVDINKAKDSPFTGQLLNKCSSDLKLMDRKHFLSFQQCLNAVEKIRGKLDNVPLKVKDMKEDDGVVRKNLLAAVRTSVYAIDMAILSIINCCYVAAVSSISTPDKAKKYIETLPNGEVSGDFTFTFGIKDEERFGDVAGKKYTEKEKAKILEALRMDGKSREAKYGETKDGQYVKDKQSVLGKLYDIINKSNIVKPLKKLDSTGTNERELVKMVNDDGKVFKGFVEDCMSMAQELLAFLTDKQMPMIFGTEKQYATLVESVSSNSTEWEQLLGKMLENDAVIDAKPTTVEKVEPESKKEKTALDI